MHLFDSLYSVHLDFYLEVELLGHTVILYNFLWDHQSVFQSGCTIYIPTSSSFFLFFK